MAQFQIIDEFDVEVCKLPYEKALSFCDYLNSIGIKAKAKEGYSNFYIIYVTNEADKLKAKLELVRHSDSAFFKEFEKASWKSGKTVSATKRLSSNSLPFTYNLFSVVSIVQILCVIVYVLSLIDQDLPYEVSRVQFVDPSLSHPSRWSRARWPPKCQKQGQSSGFWPLDLQRTLGCLGKPRGSDLSAKGWKRSRP